MDDKIYKSIVSSADQLIQKRIKLETAKYEIDIHKYYIRCLISIILAPILFIIGIKCASYPIDYSTISTTTATWIQFIGYMSIGASIMLVGHLLFTKPRKKSIDYDFEMTKEIKSALIYYWADLFDETLDNLTYDINNFITRNKKQLGVEVKTIYTQFRNPATNRINTKSENVNIEHFWLDKRKVDFIYDKCCEKYHKKSTSTIKENLSIQKSQLQNENLSLKNETLKIKINLIKPWTCQFCGNMNHGDDMSCLKCGGVRPSSE